MTSREAILKLMDGCVISAFDGSQTFFVVMTKQGNTKYGTSISYMTTDNFVFSDSDRYEIALSPKYNSIATPSRLVEEDRRLVKAIFANRRAIRVNQHKIRRATLDIKEAEQDIERADRNITRLNEQREVLKNTRGL